MKRSIVDEMESNGVAGGRGDKGYRRRMEKGQDVWDSTTAYMQHVRNRINSKVSGERSEPPKGLRDA